MKINSRSSSRDAYRLINADETFTLIILQIVSRYDKLTRREIEHITGLRSCQVTGRVYEMIHSSHTLVELKSKVKCSVSGNQVFAVKITPKGRNKIKKFC
jgi:hypothetical protein